VAPDATLATLFERAAARAPRAAAILEGDAVLSYAELEARSRAVARALEANGVGAGEVVVTAIERSACLLVALLGILRTGAAFAALEPATPPVRRDLILADTGARVILAGRPGILDPEIRVVAPTIGGRAVTVAADAAYVIHTSGSTGVPKGVIGTHRATINRFAWMWDTFPFQPGEVVCAKTSVAFVDSIWELFGGLLAGMPTAIVSAETARDPRRFVEALAGAGATRVVSVPSLLEAVLRLVPDVGERMPQLTYWICSGEPLSGTLANRFRSVTGARLLNFYGSSEVAADVTWWECGNEQGSVPIGRPIANVGVHVVDETLAPVPVGVVGELVVTGAGVGRGYVGRPALTAERFVADGLSGARGARAYRTGDLGRLRGDGVLEFVGRADDQVKLRGFRIEPGEVEAVLGACPGVRGCVAGVRELAGDRRLVAWVEGDATPEQLRAHAAERLPDYMVPALYVVLERLPLTASGKVDRRALTLPADAVVRPREPTPPGTALEELVAGIWAEVLGVEAVGVDENFFELGGHSLLLFEVAARLRATTDPTLKMVDLFEHPTVSAIVARIERGPGAEPPAPRRSRRAALNERRHRVQGRDV
jgi:amino acid adenylation domain-containing protein